MTNEATLKQGDMTAGTADDDMIPYRYPKQSPRFHQLPRYFQIFGARVGVAAWVVVSKDHRSGVAQDGGAGPQGDGHPGGE